MTAGADISALYREFTDGSSRTRWPTWNCSVISTGRSGITLRLWSLRSKRIYPIRLGESDDAGRRAQQGVRSIGGVTLSALGRLLPIDACTS